MKNDARLLLNRKKWNKSSSFKADNRKIPIKSRTAIDARKILNSKRQQKVRSPVLGSYMRTKSVAALIASTIRKEIAPNKEPGKKIKLSSDGNIIITSKSQVTANQNLLTPKASMAKSFQPSTMIWESTDADDLEHTGIQDLLDIESLPSAYIPSTSHNVNLSRKSLVSDVLGQRSTMVADQLFQASKSEGHYVFVTNLHPTVSREDVMELFGDIGFVKGADMVKPGTALVEFYDRIDAKKACDVYHNRLLDGQPMKCHLQNISSPQKPSISQRLGEKQFTNSSQRSFSSPVVTNPRSRYNPRNVQFTVKL